MYRLDFFVTINIKEKIVDLQTTIFDSPLLEFKIRINRSNLITLLYVVLFF